MKDQEFIIKDILTRSVDTIVDKEHLEAKLRSGKTLHIKLGIDPTSANLHLGRTVPLLKLRRFQELGHQVVFLVGSFTAVIGDTSDKDSERPMLTPEQVEINMKTYMEQASKILDITKTEVVYNADWLSKLSYQEIAEQADAFSVNDFISRLNIKKRLDEGKRVSLREVLYPMMQGYDSVYLQADVELGGSDQWFNLLAGRTLQKHYNQEPQDILTNVLVAGADGRKMSSSWGNTINVFDEPRDMYGKIMAIRDELIGDYFEHFTILTLDEVLKYREQLKDATVNPKNIKEILAFEITKFYHGADQAEDAKKYFQTMFRDKSLPDDIPEIRVQGVNIVDVLVEAGLAESKTQARQLITQGGVRMNDEVVKDVAIEVVSGSIIQKGKRQVIKVLL